MNGIGTVSSRALGPLLEEYLPQSKFAEKALQGSGLPLDKLGEQDLVLPQFALWELVNRLALLEDNPCFTFDCVMQSRCSLNPLTEADLAKATTDPFQSLCKYVEALNTFTPMTRFWWEIVDGIFLFRRKPVDVNDREGLQVELYALAVFARFVKDHLSDRAQVTAIHVRSLARPRATPDEWCCARLHTGSFATGLDIRMLDLTHAGEDQLSGWMKSKFGARTQVVSPDEETYRFKKLIRNYIGGGDTGIENVSNALGLSRRTLQRRLSQWGVSYSAILGELRMEIATQQLASSDMPVGEIASMLGYQHAGDFTRAFKKFMEISPTGYREFSQKIQDVQKPNGDTFSVPSNRDSSHRQTVQSAYEKHFAGVVQW